MTDPNQIPRDGRTMRERMLAGELDIADDPQIVVSIRL
jgi:hypothetical protein